MSELTYKSKLREDEWFRTTCTGCYANCAVRVHRVNGVVVKVEGDPDSSMGSQGGVCAKSSYMIQLLYNPKRYKYPLKRTNPQKGIGVDPKWKRISWEEALSETAERLKKIKQEDPSKLLVIGGISNQVITGTFLWTGAWIGAFGAVGGGTGVGTHCGQASHLGAGMNHCSWSVIPDFDHCNYILHFGSNKGTGSGHSAAMAIRKAAEARARGMKVVAFDPMCNFAGGKATEWIPILPGTDGAIALSMANIIVNELGIYDTEYLTKKTNAPYLLKSSGQYIRDKENGEPLLWEIIGQRPKTWNDLTLQDVALEGIYEIYGEKCKTVFSVVREHLKQYTAEWAAQITTVPSKTIRRIATEFATNARIGSTIEVDGVRLPYRPVAAFMFRGGQGHTNGFHNYVSVDLLNQIVGACEVPGGVIGWPTRCLGYPGKQDSTIFSPYATKDGHLTSSAWMPMPGTWPHPKPREPRTPAFYDMFTAAPPQAMMPLKRDASDIWQKFGFSKEPFEMVFGYWSNPAMTAANVEVWSERVKRMFVVYSAVLPNETTEGFADIIFPDCTGLEINDAINAEGWIFNHPVGMLDWEYHPSLRIVEPMYESRYGAETVLELFDRLGMRKDYMQRLIGFLGATNCPPPFSPGEKLSWDEITDRILKARFGDDHDLEWFKEHGFVKWKKKPEEAYWRWFVDARASIYQEWLIDYHEEVEAICKPRGYNLDWKQYVPAISYFPAASHHVESPEYDLFAFGYRDIAHTASGTQDIPWLLEVSETNPFTLNVIMNRETADKKGIKDMDRVYLENERGERISVNIHTVEGIHPQCIAMAHGIAHWLEGHPTRGRSGLLNVILRVEDKYFCPISQSIETAVRVKVYKAES